MKFMKYIQAIMQVFKEIHSQGTIKGKGSYRSLHGNFWQFTCPEADVKSEDLDISSKSIDIYSLQGDDAKNKPRKKGKK